VGAAACAVARAVAGRGLVDATGIPLASSVTGGNRNDITRLIPPLDAVPAVRGRRGQPRKRPESVLADRAYDHDKYRRLVRKRGIKPVMARRQREHGSGLGRHRWVVERTFARLHNVKRLLVRYERRADNPPRPAPARLLPRLLPTTQELKLK
jgi:transposase